MNQIQQEIAAALVQLSEKALITEAVIAKKIRENIKLQGKQKAGLSFTDIEEAVIYIEENNNLHFALHLNSANDILIKQAEGAAGLEGDARKRRLASEKSMSVLTNGDVKKAQESKTGGGKNGPKPHSKRTDKKKLNVNKNYEDW
ncbi:MAG: hypothetical protein K6A89_06905 [Treponema sp.]|nr:hypothetical protein [Treponema sp.]